MKIWALLRQKQKIREDIVYENSNVIEWDSDNMRTMLEEPCKSFDVSLPIVLEKHVQEMNRIGRAVFRKDDFIDSVNFDLMEVEVIRERKSNSEDSYGYLS